jgi:hypothetical protein
MCNGINKQKTKSSMKRKTSNIFLQSQLGFTSNAEWNEKRQNEKTKTWKLALTKRRTGKRRGLGWPSASHLMSFYIDHVIKELFTLLF